MKTSGPFAFYGDSIPDAPEKKMVVFRRCLLEKDAEFFFDDVGKSMII